MDSESFIKLDKIDRKILFELDKNCRIPAAKLAKIVRRSRQAVDYRIKELIRKKIILRFNTYLNFQQLGFRLYRVHLKLKNIPKIRNDLIVFLKNSSLVYWIAQCYGAYDVSFTAFCRKDLDFFELKNEVSSGFGSIILESDFDVMLESKQYPKMYFTNQISPPYAFGGEPNFRKLDIVEKGILNKLTYDARISVNELSRELSLTPTIVRRKIKKLENEGIIIHYFISVNKEKLGIEEHRAIIGFDNFSKAEEKRFLEYISNNPRTCFYSKKLWNLEVVFNVTNTTEYYKILEDLKKEFPEVIKSVVSVFLYYYEVAPGFGKLLGV